MRIHVYTFCWNERLRIPYFLRNYAYAERIVVYDHGSDDGSRELLGGCEVRTYGERGVIDERALTHLKNECWKESDADWVFIVDMDEFIVGSLELLERLADVPIVVPYGYDMISPYPPCRDGRIEEEVRLGRASTYYSKPCIVNPKLVQELGLRDGAHNCQPVMAGLPYYAFDLKLLHMKFLGREWYADRFEQMNERWSAYNLEHDLGWKASRAELLQGFDDLLATSGRVV